MLALGMKEQMIYFQENHKDNTKEGTFEVSLEKQVDGH